MILIIGKIKMKLKRIYIYFSHLPVIENIFIESIISRVRVVVFNASFRLNVSFISGGSQSTQRKPPTCLKSLTNFIT